MSAGRIVIADDNGVNRMLLGGILEQAGYEVRMELGSFRGAG